MREMSHTADINAALAFVTRRIEEEGIQSGEPLSSEERCLLEHLPTESLLPQQYAADPEFPPILVPRDRVYERLCQLAKNAYHKDRQLDSASAKEWEHAAALTTLHSHPMSWLLQWAGVKQRSRSLDRKLLVLSGLIVVIVMIPLMLLLLGDPPKPLQWVEVGVVLFALAGLLQLASRRIMKRRLEQTAERRHFQSWEH
jgi:hypothetical protein